MFDLIHDTTIDFDLPQLSPVTSLISTDQDEFGSLGGSPGGPLSSPSSADVVFGSYLVDRNSSTPYTDATQVSKREARSRYPRSPLEGSFQQL